VLILWLVSASAAVASTKREAKLPLTRLTTAAACNFAASFFSRIDARLSETQGACQGNGASPQCVEGYTSLPVRSVPYDPALVSLSFFGASRRFLTMTTASTRMVVLLFDSSYTSGACFILGTLRTIQVHSVNWLHVV